ncbi:MAG: FMN-binding negative transcriptional regulator [Melioribacteraceae bacterium]|nr:FMN-binding negative transcriptional regulator [Melioribacteraceae bacterium]MCF8263227.1 FMN-binding negative transcriptional regulator [Melioribacteraceae bacterium]MCF8431015.1 FMN-binding negative transcriptional regulator [Melioribacteraceae bacterium]
MYDLPYHKEKNPKVIEDFIEKYPFAFLTGCNADKMPVVTQVPVFIDNLNGKQFLRSHIMRNTDHHKAFLENENVLVVFTGHHTYVSGTWYSNPHTASTWNYMSVHVKGKIRFLGDNDLEEILKKTSLHFENYNENSTTTFENLPDDFKHRVMKAIVGIEIEILGMENIFKLSQDRDFQSYCNIIEKLKQKGESEQVIASEMEKRKAELFPENH